MALIKRGEAISFSQADMRSVDSIKEDKELHDRIISLASNIKKIAPKADDFLYFTAIMMHAAERSTLDEDGNVLKDKHGNDITAHWEVNEKTGSWKWISSDPSIKPYKNCFVPGTEILMEDGTVKNIEDVVAGDMVITHTGKSQKVLRTFITPHDGKVLNIKTRGRMSVSCTAEHPFYNLNVQSQTATDTPKHLLRQANTIKTFGFKEASLLTKYDLLSSPVINKTVKSDLTPGKARLLGLFAAEGCFGKKYNKDQSIRFTFNSNEYEILALKTKELFEKEFNNISVQIQKPTNRNICELTVTGKNICEFFRHHVGEYSLYKTLSEELVFGVNDIKLSFLGGWFDGDGCVEKTFGQLIGVSVSKNLINQISIMLNSLNIGHGVSKVKGKKDISINKLYKRCDCNDIYRITINATENEKIINCAERIRITNRGKNKKQNNFYENYGIHSVKSIYELDYIGNVYNLEVEEDNSYVANGLITHNCNGDIFPESQLKIAYKKWVGKPLCKDHISSTVDGVRGLILDTYWDAKYKRIIALCALDKINFPELARNVATGVANCVSMGTGVETSICADCGNVARTEKEYCRCVRGRTAYGEINVGLLPMELSLVVNGADQKAKIMEVLAAAEQMQNNICKHSSDYSQSELENLRTDFAKLATRLYELEMEIYNNSDNNLALRRTAATSDVYTSGLSELKSQISNVESMLKVIANKFNMEDLMAAQNNMSKNAYPQGTEAPVAPGKPQYAKEEADKIRMEDSHMRNPLTDLGPVDGLPKQDLEIKKRLLRASIEERRAIRAAALEQAQAAIKTAYPQGTEELPKGGYPADPGAKVRDTEFAVTKTQGNTGSWGDDEKVKKMLARASLKARLEKGASAGENKWNIISEADNKVIFSATFDELANRKPAFYQAVASEDFVRDLMKTIRAHGVVGATKLYKSAQEISAAPAAPAMGEPTVAPIEGAPVDGGQPAAQEPVSVSPETVDKLEEASGELSTAVSEMKGGADALQEQGDQLGATPSESETEKALADLTGGAPANVTASLNVVRKVINAGLAKKFKKNVKKLASVKDEIDMLIVAAKDNTVSSTMLNTLAQQALANANDALGKSRILKAGYVEFAKGTYNLQKRAAEERRMAKLAQATPTPKPAPAIGAQPAQSTATEDANKTKTPEEVAKEKAEQEKTAAMNTPEGRKALRHSLAASIGSNLKFSDMLDKAHPKSDSALGGIAGTSEAVVEGLPGVQKQMMDAVSHEPKAGVKKAAEELRKLVVAGKVDVANIDKLLAQGMDKEVAGEFKIMWAPVDGGAEFAAGLLKDYSAAKTVEKKAEDSENYKAKYARAYELAYDMAECGMISKKAIKENADKIVGYSEDAYETLKRVTAQRNAMNVKTASVQPGIALDSGSSMANSNNSGVDLAEALGSLWSNSPTHKRG